MLYVGTRTCGTMKNARKMLQNYTSNNKEDYRQKRKEAYKLIRRKKPAGIRHYLNVGIPQRLNAVELKKAMLVGFVEGDG